MSTLASTTLLVLMSPWLLANLAKAQKLQILNLSKSGLLGSSTGSCIGPRLIGVDCVGVLSAVRPPPARKSSSVYPMLLTCGCRHMLEALSMLVHF